MPRARAKKSATAEPEVFVPGRKAVEALAVAIELMEHDEYVQARLVIEQAHVWAILALADAVATRA